MTTEQIISRAWQNSWQPMCCIHGEKFRWNCPECDEAVKKENAASKQQLPTVEGRATSLA